MSEPLEGQSWLSPSLLTPGRDGTSGNTREFDRLWRGFMTARVTLSLILLLVQCTLYVLGAGKGASLILITTAYFAMATLVRLWARPRPLNRMLDAQWISTIGVDILTFALLQLAQSNSINYAPLFALPVLMASVLGSLLLAMGAAATITLLLFFNAAWLTALAPGESTTAQFLQAALTGAGCFVTSFLANQIATRLASEELRAQRNQLAARVQQQVNELVIESLTDGVLVVDSQYAVRAANPAARHLLGGDSKPHNGTFSLASKKAWSGLVDLVGLTFSKDESQQGEVSIVHTHQGEHRVRVRTQLTETQGSVTGRLCVMFIQDLREMEAQMRTAKLASLGRMSAAVAHEIRNPLAAITQANALLEEDLHDPKHIQLTRMALQNAHRLEKIVADVLNVSSVQRSEANADAHVVDLNASVQRICRDWQMHHGDSPQVNLNLVTQETRVYFDEEHLRRILINLLDNALRYASGGADAIQVISGRGRDGYSVLSVWSDGPPMDRSVERHLFEPFFSSQSRSSGLGLYICRELCEGHGASITYERVQRQSCGQAVVGNEFVVSLKQLPFQAPPTRVNSPSISPWHHPSL